MNIYLLEDLIQDRVTSEPPPITPLDSAMLQALYSRSPASVVDHLDRVRDTGSTQFTERYYLNYGHASIGECASTTLFMESVSLLAAKAIQATPLYRGQETSTRYLDFSTRHFHLHSEHASNLHLQDRHYDPALLTDWLSRLRTLYRTLLQHLTPHLTQLVIQDSGIPESHLSPTHIRAISARAFDIARGVLPAGASTQLSITTDFRHARQHFTHLSHHPLAEVREIATRAIHLLYTRYPQAFPSLPQEEPPQDESQDLDLYYYTPDPLFHSLTTSVVPHFDPTYTQRILDMLARRNTDMLNRSTIPSTSTLSQTIGLAGQFSVQGLLDYGSLRDLARHRKMSFPLPLLTYNYGPHPFYLDTLPSQLRTLVLETFSSFPRQSVFALDPQYRQYYIPLSYLAPVAMRFDFIQAQYLTHLRSQRSTHPTLRTFIHEIANAIHHYTPSLPLFVDNTPDTPTPYIPRGTQTIHIRDTP